MTRFLDTLPGDVSPGIREKQRPGATPSKRPKGKHPRQVSRKKCEPRSRGTRCGNGGGSGRLGGVDGRDGPLRPTVVGQASQDNMRPS
jgi:hypothetical protein